MNLLFMTPHARAERLIEARMDAERGDSTPPSSAEAEWLKVHLAGCARCREVELSRRALSGWLSTSRDSLRAPEGFAERVARAAVRPKEAGWARQEPAAPRGSRALWGFAAAVAAAALIGVTSAPFFRAAPGSAEVAVGGAARLEDQLPNFVIRAPGRGAARFRSTAIRLVEAHGGTAVTLDSAVSAVIPRSELVALMAELEQRGGIKVELKVEPSSALAQVFLRFELD